jgi:hypothetical protein
MCGQKLLLGLSYEDAVEKEYNKHITGISLTLLDMVFI